MAGSIKGIIVEIGGETSGLQNALKSVDKITKSLGQELKGLNTMLKFNPSNVTLLTQKQTVLKEQIEQTSERLKQLKEAQRQYIESGGDLNTPEYRNLQREIINTERELKDSQTEQKNFGSVTAQVIAVAGEKLKGLGSSIENVGKKLAGLSTGATIALGGIVKSSIDFESAWTGVTKTVDGTDEELAKVRDEILKLASATGTSSSEIAGVAEAAGQLGVGVKDVSAFTETMVRLGDSTNLSADEAATSIAQFYNIMKQDLSTVDNFGSALVALGNNSATSESKIMDMASRIAGAGSQIGLTSQQVLALSASLSSVGLEAEGGGSAISQVMTQIDKDVALNSKNLKTWAKTSGMSVKDFSKLWKEDTMGALQAVIKGMGETTDKGGNLNVLLDKLGITSIRQTDTMKRLSNASDLLNDSLNIANTAWEQNTALTDESQKRYETTAAKIGQVKETIKEVGISLGEVVLPVIQEFADKIKGVVEKFTSLDDGTKEIIVKILLLAATLSPLLILIGKLVTGIGTILTLAPQIVSAFGKIKTIIMGLKTAITAIGAFLAANPIGIVIIAITAIIATLVVLYNKCEWFRDGVNNIVNKIKDTVLNIAETIKTFFTETIPNAFDEFISKLSELGNTIKEAVSNGWNAIATFFTETIPNALKDFWDSVVSFFTESIPNFISSVLEWVSELPYKIGYQIGLILGHIIQFGIDVWNWITTKIPEFIEKIVTFVSELPGKIWTFLLDIINKVIKWGQECWKNAKEYTTRLINDVTNFFSTLPGKIWAFLTDIISKIITWGQTIWDDAKTYTMNLINDVTMFFSTLPGKIWEHLTDIINKIIEWGNNMVAKGKEAAVNLVNTVYTTIAELPGKVMEVGRNIVEGLWNGIQGAGDWIRGKVGEFARGILDGMKAALGIHSPSKLFRDEVGKYIALGVGEGFLDNIGKVTKTMQNKLDIETGKISSNLNVAAQVGTGSLKSSGDTVVTVNFYPQKMTDAELDNAFNYINRRFGMAY